MFNLIYSNNHIKVDVMTYLVKKEKNALLKDIRFHRRDVHKKKKKKS